MKMTVGVVATFTLSGKTVQSAKGSGENLNLFFVINVDKYT
jgi:hypothetical protein